jgi:hypothetical protein
MENPTNAELAKQIETVAQTVAKIYEQMATKEEFHAGLQSLETKMNTRFDAVEQRLDRIEKSHGYRLETLERDVAVLKT